MTDATAGPVPPASGPHVFARCTVCTHASMYRPGTPCRMCEGEVVAVPAPADLWSGWRCSCYHCVLTLC